MEAAETRNSVPRVLLKRWEELAKEIHVPAAALQTPGSIISSPCLHAFVRSDLVAAESCMGEVISSQAAARGIILCLVAGTVN